MHLLFAATTTTSTTGGSSGGGRFVLPLLLVGLAVAWLIFVRPQRRKQKLQQTMQTELAVGDEILTAGGVFGTVTEVGDEEVRVEIAPSVEIRLARRAIAAQLTDHAPVEEPDDEPESNEASDEASDEASQPG
jgi:preprotein translocase subunit YajC